MEDVVRIGVLWNLSALDDEDLPATHLKQPGLHYTAGPVDAVLSSAFGSNVLANALL